MEREVELEHRAVEASNALARIQVPIFLSNRIEVHMFFMMQLKFFIKK